MRRRLIRTLVTLASTCGLLTAAGLASGPGTAWAQSGGRENFTVVATANAGEGPGTIYASGVFTAVGVDHEGGRVDNVVFPDGTFKIRHDLPGGTINVSIDPVTCVLTLTGSGIPFQLEDGTGAYKGISGTGTVSINGHQLLARKANGKCSNTGLVGLTIFGGAAHISFG